MTSAEQIATLKTLWFDPTMTRHTIADALGLSFRYVRELAARHQLPDRRGAQFQQRMAIMIRGQRFANAAEAAKHFGLHESHVGRQVWEGRADSIGLGTGRYRRTLPSPCRKPLTIGPMTWSGRKEAAAALGITYARLCQLIREGRTDILIARAMKVEAKQLTARSAEQHAA